MVYDKQKLFKSQASLAKKKYEGFRGYKMKKRERILELLHHELKKAQHNFPFSIKGCENTKMNQIYRWVPCMKKK